MSEEAIHFLNNIDFENNEEVYETMFSLFTENQKLKKQLSNSHQMKNQQKVFMQWLEQNIENEEYCYLSQNPSERCRKDVFEEVLSKYKEIIGCKE